MIAQNVCIDTFYPPWLNKIAFCVKKGQSAFYFGVYGEPDRMWKNALRPIIEGHILANKELILNILLSYYKFWGMLIQFMRWLKQFKVKVTW